VPKEQVRLVADSTAGGRVGIDIGGTFTDLVMVDEETGRIRVEKSLSTPGDLWEGISAGLRKLEASAPATDMIVHGTTVGINALLERRGRPTGLITTHGFRDVYEIARNNRIELYELRYRKPVPLVPRRHRLEVRERIDYTGAVIEPLLEDDVVECVRAFKGQGIDSVAICFLHAYANPAHELLAGEIVLREYPEASVSLSHVLARQWREYERTSTTVVNAYIMSLVGDYLARIETSLLDWGYERPFYIGKSSGGLMSATAAKAKPVQTIMSGPAGGATAAAHIGQQSGYANVVALDMGGTSTDVSLINDGALRVTSDAEIDRHPLMVTMLDIKSIGAGGGSIAWIDEGGALNVGPRSAGAVPGPVAYGKGGVEPTVADAKLVLGHLHPDHFLGGELPLFHEEARSAIEERIAKPLGLDATEAASGIVEVVDTMMAYAVRAITIERGLDPTRFALLAFGGSGPMHACAIARNLNLGEILVPVGPGALSAFGMLVSDIRHDFVRTLRVSLRDDDTVTLLNDSLGEMAAEARTVLEGERAAWGSIELRPAIDMRYVGQLYTITVPLTDGAVSEETIGELERLFHALHDRTYGHSSADEMTEVVNVRLAALGRVRRPEPAPVADGAATPSDAAYVGDSQTYFSVVHNHVATQIFRREELLAGNRISGPAIVVEKTSTTVVEPGFELRVAPQGHLSLKRLS
jgi:N-methylhydantoinase A